MKVLMLAPEPFFQPRGTPISVYFRIKALSDLGHQTDLITYPLGRDIPFPGFSIRRVPNLLGLKAVKIGPSWPKIPLDGLMALRAFGALARARYDVVYSHEEAAFFGIALAKLFGVPHLYDMHSSLPQQLTNFQFSASPLLKSIFTGLEDAVLKSSGSVIVICRDLFDYVRSKGFAGKAVFLENFMDFNDFEEAPASPETIARIRRETAPGGEKNHPLRRQLRALPGPPSPHRGHGPGERTGRPFDRRRVEGRTRKSGRTGPRRGRGRPGPIHRKSPAPGRAALHRGRRRPRFAADLGHEHAAQDLFLSQIRQALRGHQALHAYAGSHGGDGHPGGADAPGAWPMDSISP